MTDKLIKDGKTFQLSEWKCKRCERVSKTLKTPEESKRFCSAECEESSSKKKIPRPSFNRH